jgi:hypothetical protein
MNETPAAPLRELREDEIRSYADDGVLMARGLMSPEWFDRVERAVVRVMEAPTPISGVFSAPDDGFHMEVGLFVSDDEIREVVYDSPMAEVVRRLMGSQKVHFFYDQMFSKQPGNQHPTPWHHDLTFWPVIGEQICSVWIPLDRVTRESSGLEFVRGSHRWAHRYQAISPMYNEQLVNPEHEELPDIEGHREEYDIAGWSMEPGDMLFFHPLVLHGSSGNRHLECPRRALSFRWLGDDVEYRPTPYSMPFPAPGLSSGDRAADPVFPQILPRLG